MLDTPTPTTTINLSSYQIDDVSFGNVKRFSLYVTTPFPISINEVKTVCDMVVEDFKQQQSFNAVTVFVSDTDKPTFGFTIASCTFAPNGEWADADKVQTGSYSSHTFSYIFQPKIKDPDTALSERPTNEEFNICAEWTETEQDLVDSGADILESEGRANKIVAEKYGINPNSVYEITLKCVLWTHR